MEITLTPIYEGPSFVFPTLPSEITVKNGAKYQSYEIISKGTVKIPKGRECSEVSWDGFFFGESKIGEPMMDEYEEPRLCVWLLEELRDNGVPVQLKISDVGINRDMTISSFTWKPYGAHGNIKYAIVLTEWRHLEVQLLKPPDAVPVTGLAADTPQPRVDSPAAPASTLAAGTGGANYTVQAGDTLCGIARKVGGGEANWVKIYEANAAVIEQAAQQYGKASSDRGHWIYTGTVLTIPG